MKTPGEPLKKRSFGRGLLRAACFLLLTVLLLAGFARTFGFKYSDGVDSMRTFYRQAPGSVDVLFLGNSHVFEDVDTGALYDTAGIAAYDLCAARQVPWSTYWYLKEALKTQRPKLIVMDCFGLTTEADYASREDAVKSLAGLKLSLDKLSAIRECVPPEERLRFLFGYPLYHGRYSDLGREDYLPQKGIANRESWKGYIPNYLVDPQTRPDIAAMTGEKALLPKAEDAFVRIMDLAGQAGIPLVLICSPFPLTYEHMQVFHTAERMAAERGIPFWNFNEQYDEIGLDFDQDFADYSHLNHRGSRKFSEFLAKRLAGAYDLPDRRNDPAFSGYEVMAEDVRCRAMDEEIRSTWDRGAFLAALGSHPHLVVLPSCRGSYAGTEEGRRINAETRRALGETGRLALGPETTVSVMAGAADEQARGLERDPAGGAMPEVLPEENLVEDPAGNMAEDRVEDPAGPAGDLRLKLNLTEYYAVSDGINYLIYDQFADQVVDCAGFRFNGAALAEQKTAWDLDEDGEWEEREAP